MSLNRSKKKILRTIGRMLASPIVNVLCKTLRIEEINKSSFESLLVSNQNFVFAFWHGTMMVPWYILKRYSPSTLISQSKDGDLLVSVLSDWQYKIKRGSSSKDGKEALKKLIEEANTKRSIAITPDGPRGPAKVMKAGAVIIAKKTQTPIILIGVSYKKRFVLKSWDRFELPYLFSKVRIIFSDPIIINDNLSYNETDQKIIQIQNKLNELQYRAEEY